jgi:predicted nuclease of restriction endonuclease-like (RecB) superfamily
MRVALRSAHGLRDVAQESEANSAPRLAPIGHPQFLAPFCRSPPHANLGPQGRDDTHPQLLTSRQYKELLADLRQIIGAGKQEAERAAAQALLESYWSIGQRITREKLNTRAAYHNAILTDLSADLAIDLRTLQRTVTFYQTYQRPPRIEGLNWAHFRILMQLQDANERAFYEQLAAEDSLSATRLRTAIQGARYDSAQRQKPGKPVTLPRPGDPSYVYKAEVRDVIDADTLLLDIDLGFEVIRRQSIGLAHVFYAFNNQGIERAFLKGRYLNQELIDKGFAKPI